MAKLIVKHGNYSNKDVQEYVIRYITRTRPEEDRRYQLITYGSPNTSIVSGNDLSVSRAIKEFRDVEKFYINQRIRDGRRVHHEILSIYAAEAKFFTSPLQYYWLGMELSKEYDQMGHQVVFAAHRSQNDGYHIHFVINGTCYLDGKKYHSEIWQENAREEKFNKILTEHIYRNCHQQSPMFFQSYSY